MRASYNRHALAAVLPVLVLVAWATPSWGQGEERIGTVLAVEETAEVQAQAAVEWERLRFRDAIFRNDTARTAANSKLKLLMRDDSILTMSESSEMEFTEFVTTQQQQRSVVNMLVGTLKVVTTSILGAGSSLEIRTPNTVAGVRGTTFIISFIPPATSRRPGFTTEWWKSYVEAT